LNGLRAALIGVLPTTPGGSDWQAYYDNQLDITWTTNANINGADIWDNQVAWSVWRDEIKRNPVKGHQQKWRLR
jgi:hypothetical protein